MLLNGEARKGYPIWSGVLMYFPDALLEVARVSQVGNEQHNPGEPLHWARDKSTDQLNTALRHAMDHGTGNPIDTDGTYHLAKAIWRLCAELQTYLEVTAPAQLSPPPPAPSQPPTPRLESHTLRWSDLSPIEMAAIEEFRSRRVVASKTNT